MAAISHIRNRKEAKSRENVETILQKCLTPSGEVCKNSFLRLLRNDLKCFFLSQENEFNRYYHI